MTGIGEPKNTANHYKSTNNKTESQKHLQIMLNVSMFDIMNLWSNKQCTTSRFPEKDLGKSRQEPQTGTVFITAVH